jgi:hypothetical protein
MKVQFEWQAGTDDGQWETIVETRRRGLLSRLPPIPRWGWVVMGVMLALLAVGGISYVRRRYAEARSQVAFQIQGVIDLEARAFADRNREQFLAQQDEAAPDWYDRRKLLIESVSSLSAEGWRSVDLSDPMMPALPAEIQSIDLQGKIAWVDVIEGEPPVRRVRFYRQTERGWVHTAPRSQFWGVAIELQYGDMRFRYHRRDEPYVSQVVDYIAEVAIDYCIKWGCSTSGSVLEVRFVIEPTDTLDQLPRLEGDELLIASPWLSGIPVEGTWTESYLDELTRWVKFAMAYPPA